LSARFSISHGLHLKIDESRVHVVLIVGVGIAALASLSLLHLRGHTLLAFLLLPCAVCLVWRLRLDSLAGAELIWRQGCWLVRRGCREVAVELLPASRAVPGGIYLVWREGPRGRRRRAWLFQDSAQRDQLRRLRVRLRLQR
jgi:hypothetical protein